jgi:hypothetical protein
MNIRALRCHSRIKPLIFIALFAALALAQAAETPPKPIYPGIVPVCPCEDLVKVLIPNTTIDSAGTDPSNGWCRVTATVTHPPSGDRVKVFIGLPVTNWNGRFRGNGGGGYLGGSASTLRTPVSQGYASGATDTGHEGGSGKFARLFLAPGRRSRLPRRRGYTGGIDGRDHPVGRRRPGAR